MLSSHELIELSKVELENINPIALKELTDICIDPNAPIENRIETFFNKIGNPYCFLVNGTPVQISYGNHNKTLDKCLYQYLTNKKNSDNSII